MSQAQDAANEGNYTLACSICTEGYGKTNDYRILYNKALYAALNQDYDTALECCDTGMKNHSSNYESFNKAKIEYLKLSRREADLYNYALELWTDKNKTSKEILEILYLYNHDEWAVLFNALYPETKEN